MPSALRAYFTCLLVMVLVNACGGDSSGTSPDGSYTYTPDSLNFSAQVDAVAPDPQVITLTAETSNAQIPDLSSTGDLVDFTSLEIVSSDSIEVTVQVKSPALLGIGTHEATVSLSNSNGTVNIPVSYEVTEIPPGPAEVHFISPYIATPGIATDVVIRGSGFSIYNSSNLPVVTIGGIAASNITVINDSTLAVTAPALTVGTHAVEVTGKAENFTSTASLKVIDDQVYSTTSLSSSGEKSRLIYDQERQAVYVVNTTSATLERYRYQGGTSWTVDSLTLSGLSDAALSPDGATLVLVDGSSFYAVDPAAATMTAGTAINAPLGIYDSVATLASVNSGKMMAVGNDQWSSVYRYDLLTGSVDSLTYINDSQIEVSYSLFQPGLFEVQNGSRVYLGESGISTSRLYLLDAVDNSIIETGITASYGGFYAVSQTPDGARVLVNGKDIYNADFSSLLGSLPEIYSNGVISPEGTTAYVFIDFNGVHSNLLKAYDITNPAAAVQIGSDVLMPAGPGMRAQMQISDDGNSLFLAGADGLNIIDLTSFSF